MPDDPNITVFSESEPDEPSGVGADKHGQLPTSIDRFQIRSVLGRGGFGVVYLAFDERLERQVALKVPNAKIIARPDHLQLYLKEARTVAKLEHPNIVPVLEVGATDEYPIYIVSKYVEGMDLAHRLRRSPPSQELAARWIEHLCEALRLAHSQGIVHRDIKPQNVLVDQRDNVFLVDFGLALRDEEVGTRLPGGGTPAYMSPEQVKGEGHRVDGRSDIFSLGIVLYEMLANHRPFKGDSSLELFEQITGLDPKPLRQWNDSIDKELERICQKMLSKRKSRRYSNATDLSDDLSRFRSRSSGEWKAVSSDETATLPSGVDAFDGATTNFSDDGHPTAASRTSGSRSLAIVPKGLRSFDDRDVDFFLELLPGPRDRDGLPDSISFWKSRIEERDSERTFAVGLVYGSSGCGKSSMMKAGLLPRLSRDVVPVYLEATPDQTESGLLNSIRKKIAAEGSSTVDDSSNLVSTLASVRRGGLLPAKKKLLIVLDQFEQWLHVHQQSTGQELLDALAQCDGSRVQAIVMVRDDFWMAATRFFQDLDILLIERANSAAVDLFDLEHAERVLKAFGRAFGKLTTTEENEKQANRLFIREAIKGLSENNKVISVRIALFAEMMKVRPWTIVSLKEVGGTAGIGATFLEETFSASGAPPEHRYHQTAARAVLASLLPEAGTDIKGHMRSRQELLAASGYLHRPRDFDSLLRILDGELRLITPVDRQLEEPGVGEPRQEVSPAQSGVYYQLTHDYLVPSLRDWLTRKKRETKRGRAELKLAERAASWSSKRENKQLPSLLEWTAISSLTERKRWTEPQQAMMRKASQVYALRGGVTLAILIAMTWAGLSFKNAMEREQQQLIAQKDHEQKEAEAEKLVEGLLTSDPSQLQSTIERLKEYHVWAKDDLSEALAKAAAGSARQLHAGLALISNEPNVEATLIAQVGERLLDAAPQQFMPMRNILAPRKDDLLDRYWTVALDRGEKPARRFRSACALAAYEPSSPNWDNAELCQFLAEQLVAANPIYLSVWEEALKPVAPRLLPQLSKIFNQPLRSELSRSIATSLIADYAQDDANFLVTTILDADSKAFDILFPSIESHGEIAIKQLESIIALRSEPDWNDIGIDASWTEPNAETVQSFDRAHGAIDQRFAFCQNMPWGEFQQVAERLRTSGYRPTRVRPFLSFSYEADDGKPSVQDVWIAAIWTRDGKQWLLDKPQAKSALPTVHENPDKQGLTVCDVSLFPIDTDAEDPLCLVLWSEPISEDEQRRIVVGLDLAELEDATEVFRAEGFIAEGFLAQTTVQVATDASGRRLYSGVWSNQGAVTSLDPAYPGQERIYQPQWDVSSAPFSLRLDPLAVFRIRIDRINALPPEEQQTPEHLAGRATAHYRLGDSQLALQDMSALESMGSLPKPLLPFKAISFARLARASEAAEAEKEFLKLSQDEAERAYVSSLVQAGLGDFDRATELLKAAEIAFDASPDRLYKVAAAYARCVTFGQSADEQRANEFAKLALKVLAKALDQGYREPRQLRTDSDWASLSSDQRFLELLARIDNQGPYAALWRSNLEYESRLLTSQRFKADNQQTSDRWLAIDAIKPLLAEGFRPFAISVANHPREAANHPGEAANFQGDSSSMVLHRPIVVEERKESLALQQANAAVALLKMAAPKQVWSLLKLQSEPRLRSYLIHQLTDLNVDPESILNQLELETETTRRSALILAVGEYARADLLGPSQSQAVKTDLLNLYGQDPAPSIHAACEWTLRQMGAADDVDNILRSKATGTAAGDSQWYVTKNAAHTMMLLNPSGQFEMGSPITEQDRYGGPTHDVEARHRIKLPRKFAIASHEVTVEQFQAFRPKHDFNRVYSPELDSPANVVSWYDATAYCNWLSEQEGIPRDQWCYDPEQSFSDGMRLYPDCLERTGYRLPTEAEWEFACRAGATGARYFGESETLLGEYAWYARNSDSKGNLPVGSLKPNDFGLFDMQGNIFEWCQNATGSYRYEDAVASDTLDSLMIDDTVRRILRGGSFFNPASYVRSSYRNNQHPHVYNGNNGFRPVRTYY